MLSLFERRAKHNGLKTEQQLTFEQCGECTDLIDKIDKTLGVFVLDGAYRTG